MGKRNARPGFQVAFESNCALLVGELDHDINRPRTVLGRMWTAPCVVFGMSPTDIRRETRVVLMRRLVTPADVHESLKHHSRRSTSPAVLT